MARQEAQAWEKPIPWPLRPWRGEKFPGFWFYFGYLIGGFFRILVQVRYRGLANIPKTGPALLVSNHISHVDPIMVGMMVGDAKRLPTMIGKQEMFDSILGRAVRGIGAIPVKRGGGSDAVIETVTQALADGKIVGIMAEGTITKDPEYWPQPAKTGAARIALASPGVPVIPVVQWGVHESFDFYNKRLKWLKRTKHRILVFEPLDIDPDATVESITEQINVALRKGVEELKVAL